MNKTYNKQKQPKKQYTSGAITKLHKAHAERGMREPSKIKQYRGEFVDGDKTFIYDFDTNCPIFAKIHFEGIAKENGWAFKRIFAY